MNGKRERLIKRNLRKKQKEYADESLPMEEGEGIEPGPFEGMTLEDVAKANQKSSWTKALHWVSKNPSRLVVSSFFLVILLGSLLLSLPLASRSPGSTDFFTAFFTATSATCVTGLVLVDTMTHWSGFGQGVILALIQIGGLSLLTILSAFGIGLHRKMNLSTTRALQESTAGLGFTGTFALVKRIMVLTFSTEALGAVLLIWRFTKYMPFPAAFQKGFFQAISAYCNAGFDLMGDYSGPFSSLTAFSGDPWILLTSAFLFIGGGLGFVVWTDLLRFRKERQLQFHTKLILAVTGLLLFSGMLFTLLLEWNTEGAMNLGALEGGEKFLGAFFQSATLRTAGFNSIDQAGLTGASKYLAVLYMIIGAGPASTGGGIKLTTFAIIVASILSDLRGSHEESRLFRHRVRQELIRRSFTILFIASSLVAFAAIVMDASLSPSLRAEIPFIDLLFESASAFGTVGLSAVGTSRLSFLAHLAIVVNMFLGRVGPASFALSFVNPKPSPAEKVLPEAKTFVG